MSAFSEVPVYELGLVAYTHHPNPGMWRQGDQLCKHCQDGLGCLTSPQKRKVLD